jgi:hypothetical protein
VVLDAEIRMGALLAGIPKKGKKKEYGSTGGTIPTLPPGVTKKQSHEAQRLYKAKNLTLEILRELDVANRILARVGNPQFQAKNAIGANAPIEQTWEQYCRDIGVERRSSTP